MSKKGTLIITGIVVALGSLGAATLRAGQAEPVRPREDRSQAAADFSHEPAAASEPAVALPPPESPRPAPRAYAPEGAAEPARADSSAKATFARGIVLRDDDAPSSSARTARQRSPEGQAATVLGGSAEGSKAQDFSSVSPSEEDDPEPAEQSQ